MRIRTEHVDPPIPIRDWDWDWDWDWAAYDADNYEPGMPVGEGTNRVRRDRGFPAAIRGRVMNAITSIPASPQQPAQWSHADAAAVQPSPPPTAL
jgi:hypothetical protein